MVHHKAIIVIIHHFSLVYDVSIDIWSEELKVPKFSCMPFDSPFQNLQNHIFFKVKKVWPYRIFLSTNVLNHYFFMILVNLYQIFTE